MGMLRFLVLIFGVAIKVILFHTGDPGEPHG